MKSKILRCAITDRTLFSGDDAMRRSALVHQAGRFARDGVDLLQLREKDLPILELTVLALELLRAIADTSARLLINARADVAVAVRAQGVHLTSSPDELTPRQIHNLYAKAGLPPPEVTVSCHSLEDVLRNRLEPVTAVLFGPVFEKRLPDGGLLPGSGLSLLAQACAMAAPIPVLALGGVTPGTLGACLNAGASGVAGIRLFQASEERSF